MEKPIIDRLITISVDVQNDFLEGGSLAVPNGNEVIEPSNRLLAFARNAGGLVVATCDAHPERTPHFDIWPIHCVAGTQGAAFHKDLQLQKDDTIIRKGMGQTDGYSGFEGQTEDGRTLQEIITPTHSERVGIIVGGVATEKCVLSTVLDGTNVDPSEGSITFFAATDAMRAIDDLEGAAAIERMRQAGVIITNTTDITNGEAFTLA